MTTRLLKGCSGQLKQHGLKRRTFRQHVTKFRVLKTKAVAVHKLRCFDRDTSNHHIWFDVGRGGVGSYKLQPDP